MKKIIEYLKKPSKILIWLDNKNIIKLDDTTYLKLEYKIVMEEKLNLENPKTLNEKLQWLKLNNKQKIYTEMVDKYEVKKYIKKIIGEEYVIPTIDVFKKFEDIDFNKLPNQFVLKCTHDSGSTVVCKNKENFNINKAKKKINKALKTKFYKFGREYPYKDVEPRIICEKYMENKDGTPINDYKFYCFNGKAYYVMICTERETGNPKFYYFDRQGVLQKDMSLDGKELKIEKEILDKSIDLNKMFEIAEKLSKNIKFVRTDLYSINDKIYFGEFTFFPSSGFDNTRTKECDEQLTKYLEIKGRY